LPQVPVAPLAGDMPNRRLLGQRLRRKLSACPGMSNRLMSVRGKGYLLH
jgi:DNA-binding response OmpR family regulator